MEQTTNIIELKHITKTYEDGYTAVSDFNLEVKQGEFITFLGPSGCGKTTTLRMIAGFDIPTEGEILLNGAPITSLPPNKRPINTVFQRYALFPHMNIYENIAFGLRQKKTPEKAIAKKVKKVLELVDLTATGPKKFKSFSLGMKQRLGVGLALLGGPDLLLLDEPINGLDPEGIREMRELLLRLNRERGLTILVSSHILGELSKIATRYGIIQQGRMVEQITAGELAQKCTDYLHLRAEQPQKAAALLERALHLTRWEMRPEGEIRIHEMVDGKAVGRVLAEAGISVEEMGLHRQDLEEDFLERMGGADHVSF